MVINKGVSIQNPTRFQPTPYLHEENTCYLSIQLSAKRLIQHVIDFIHAKFFLEVFDCGVLVDNNHSTDKSNEKLV